MKNYVGRVNTFLDSWLEKDGYKRLLTEFVEEDHNYYLRVYIDFADAVKESAEESSIEHAGENALTESEAKEGSAQKDEMPAADVLADEETAEKLEEAQQGDLHTIGINDCANVSRRLSKWLDQQDFIEEAYTLEVCSRGFLPGEETNPQDV